jgi:protein-S-isoprenylcysteine O-methyltransferase Ste14
LHPLPFSGGPAYAILFWVTYALWIVLETIGSRTKRSRDTSKARDRGSFRLIMLLLWLALGLDFALSFLLPQATILWKRASLFFIGITLMLAGMAFRFYAMSVLGRFFTYDVAIHAGQGHFVQPIVENATAESAVTDTAFLAVHRNEQTEDRKDDP